MRFFYLVGILTTWLAVVVGQEYSAEKPILYFDFGGVLVRPNSQMQLDYLVNTLGFPLEAVQDSPYFGWMQLHPVEENYLKQKGEECHILLSQTDFDRYSALKKRSVQEIPGMCALVLALRQKGYEVNLVTNVRTENLDLVEPFRSLFTHVMHCPRHPGERREIWECEWFSHSSQPSQFLLVDDQEPNVIEANQLGMQAIQFEDLDSLTRKLAELGLTI